MSANYCGNCGTENTQETKFCKNCGKNVQSGDVSSQTAYQAPVQQGSQQGYQQQGFQQYYQQKVEFNLLPSNLRQLIRLLYASIVIGVFLSFFIGFGTILGIIFIVFSFVIQFAIIYLIVNNGLQKRANWARILVLAFSILSIFSSLGGFFMVLSNGSFLSIIGIGFTLLSSAFYVYVLAIDIDTKEFFANPNWNR